MRVFIAACTLGLMLTSCAEKPKPKVKVVKVKLTAAQEAKRPMLIAQLEDDYNNSADKLVGRDINDYAELIKLADEIGTTEKYQSYAFLFPGVGGRLDGELGYFVSIIVSDGRITRVTISPRPEY